MTYEIITEVQGLSDRFQAGQRGDAEPVASGPSRSTTPMGQIADAARRTAQSIREFEGATVTCAARSRG